MHYKEIFKFIIIYFLAYVKFKIHFYFTVFRKVFQIVTELKFKLIIILYQSSSSYNYDYKIDQEFK